MGVGLKITTLPTVIVSIQSKCSHVWSDFKPFLNQNSLFIITNNPKTIIVIVLDSNCIFFMQGPPQGPGGFPALWGDGADPWGVCRGAGGPHSAAGSRHHHHQERVSGAHLAWMLSLCYIVAVLYVEIGTSRDCSVLLFKSPEWHPHAVCLYIAPSHLSLFLFALLKCFLSEQSPNHCVLLAELCERTALFRRSTATTASLYCNPLCCTRETKQLVCTAYLSVKYLIKGWFISISHLIIPTKQPLTFKWDGDWHEKVCFYRLLASEPKVLTV